MGKITQAGHIYIYILWPCGDNISTRLIYSSAVWVATFETVIIYIRVEYAAINHPHNIH